MRKSDETTHRRRYLSLHIVVSVVVGAGVYATVHRRTRRYGL